MWVHELVSEPYRTRKWIWVTGIGRWTLQLCPKHSSLSNKEWNVWRTWMPSLANQHISCSCVGVWMTHVCLLGYRLQLRRTTSTQLMNHQVGSATLGKLSSEWSSILDVEEQPTLGDLPLPEMGSRWCCSCWKCFDHCLTSPPTAIHTSKFNPLNLTKYNCYSYPPVPTKKEDLKPLQQPPTSITSQIAIEIQQEWQHSCLVTSQRPLEPLVKPPQSERPAHGWFAASWPVFLLPCFSSRSGL